MIAYVRGNRLEANLTKKQFDFSVSAHIKLIKSIKLITKKYIIDYITLHIQSIPIQSKNINFIKKSGAGYPAKAKKTLIKQKTTHDSEPIEPLVPEQVTKKIYYF